MKTVKYKKEIIPEYQYLLTACEGSGKRPLFFDIETTGFSPKSNMVYLIGLSYPDERKRLCSVQFLAEGIDDERQVLLNFLEVLKDRSDMLLTGYNINSFDIPFLNERLRKYDLPSIPLSSRDLFSDVRRLSNIFPMKGRKLKDIEAFLGIMREKDMSGGDLIPVFFEYALSHEKSNEEKLLSHNLSDIIDLFPLLVLDEIKKLFSPELSIKKIVPLDTPSVSFSGNSGINVFSPFSIRTDRFFITFDKDEIKGTIHFEHCMMKHYFPDQNTYVYLIEEERIIPKALSHSLEKERYRKPLKEECFVEEESDFYPVPEGFSDEATALLSPLYKRSYNEKQYYIKKDRHAVTEGFLNSYAGMLIKSYLSTKLSGRRRKTFCQDRSPCNP